VTDVVDPYFDTEAGCLHNLLGIRDAAALATVEAAIVSRRARQVDRLAPVPTSVGDWCAVHRHLFGDVYEWAGEFRTVNITKGEHTFHPASHLGQATDYCASQMRQIADQTTPDKRLLSEQLSTLLSDMNEAHPFREGNGRTQRHIIGQLAAHHEHSIAWKAISPQQNIDLSIASGVEPHAFAPALRIAMDIAREYDVKRSPRPARGRDLQEPSQDSGLDL
jgi:cell filamentation protein